LHAKEVDHLIRLKLFRRQQCDGDVEIAADQRAEQQQHGGPRADAEAHIGMAQRPEHRQSNDHDDENADQDGKETRRQRHVV
jgi:hypothetical protein